MRSPNKTTAIGAVICLILAFSLAVVAQPVSADWSMFRTDPARIGVGTDNPTGNSVLAPTQLWKTNLTWTPRDMEGQFRLRGFTEAAVVDGVVYVGADSSVTFDRYHTDGWIDVYALNATNGSEIWDYRDDSTSTISPPAMVGGVVYFATDRNICALNASDGSLLWNYPAGMFYSYPVVVDDRFFIGSGDNLLALNATNGDKIWNYTKSAFYSPAVANGVVYVGALDYNIYALNATTGDKIWSSYADDIHMLPSVSNGVVYTMSAGENVYAFNAVNGVKLWNYSTYDGVSSVAPSFSIENDTLYTRNGYNMLYTINAVNGAKIWNVTIENYISAPTVVNNVVYVCSPNGLYALSAYNGEILWNYTVSGGFSSAVVVNGIIYSGNAYDDENNQFYAVAVPSLTVAVPQESFPDVLIVAVSVTLIVVVAAGLLVYFKKHKEQPK